MELPAEGHCSKVIAKALRLCHGVAWHNGALQAHAHLEVRVRDGPVYVGAAHLYDGLIRAQSATSRGVAPCSFADFEKDRAGEILRDHSVHLYAQPLLGVEFVLAAVVACLAVAASEVAVLAVVKVHDPFAGNLEIHCPDTLSLRENKSCCQKQYLQTPCKDSCPFSGTFFQTAIFLDSISCVVPHPSPPVFVR